eukprot:9900183-Ditylum_brightwellii.AAC.1
MSELHHKRCHRHGKCHARKHEKRFCDYNGLYHHDEKDYDYYQACRKHIQPTHHITEEQRHWQVQFVKHAKRYTKKHGLSAKEVKYLSTFAKYKINKTIKQHYCSMYTMNNFKDLSFSSIYESIQSIMSDTSEEGSDNEDHKLASKK